jgi:Zeta toxin
VVAPKVILVGGCPGAGKTTLGRAIAARLGYASLTIDDLLGAARAITCCGGAKICSGLLRCQQVIDRLAEQDFVNPTHLGRQFFLGLLLVDRPGNRQGFGSALHVLQAMLR